MKGLQPIDQALLQAALDSLTEPLMVIGESGYVVFVNKQWQQSFGWLALPEATDHRHHRRAPVGPTPYQTVCLTTSKEVELGIESILGGTSDSFETTCESAVHGENRTLKLTVLPLEPGRKGALLTFHDLTEQQREQERFDLVNLELRVRARTAELEAANLELEAANDRLRHDACHDALTGLPNRLLFTERLAQAFAQHKRDPNLDFAVLFMDLDRFKVINDSLGHSAGDALLVAVSDRLAACVRDGDTVARFGGDEFTVLLENCGAERAHEVAQRLRQALARPFWVSGRSFILSGSVGVVLAEASHEQPQDLLRDADLAMYRAKMRRSGRHEVFDVSMREGAVSQLELEADLREAFVRRTLVVHYQPVVRLTDLSLARFEALVRWPHPTLGLLTPDAFISLAEETGLITELDRYVLGEACHQLHQWQREFPDLTELGVNVNLSSQQFLQRGLLWEVERALMQNDLSPRHLNLEVTERLLMHPVAAVDEVVAQLVARGVGLCLDDFGTGYASLSYLHRFPATGLKIDRSFIRDISERGKSATLVEGVTLIARKLGMRVVAEGVETQAQLEQLRELGCEYGQGYLFAKPLTAEQARNFTAELTSQGVSRT